MCPIRRSFTELADACAGYAQGDVEAQANVQNAMQFLRAQRDQFLCKERCSVPGIEDHA